jgi:hypothetical protein
VNVEPLAFAGPWSVEVARKGYAVDQIGAKLREVEKGETKG